MVVDVTTELAREDVSSELLYTSDLVLMNETIEKLRNKSRKWKGHFEHKDLKANIWKTTVMVCGGITKDVISKNKAYPCGVWRESKG